MSASQCTTQPQGIRLDKILPSAQNVGSSDVMVRSCCGQWNECEPSDLYVAVVGNEMDGHDYAPDAVRRGATAVVGERLLAVDCPQFIVEDSRQAYGLICHALAGRPSDLMTTIGVSGTDGKTVTSHLIHSVIQAAGHRAGLATSIESQLGSLRLPPSPSFNPPVMADQLMQMAMNQCTHAIVESSSVSLAQRACSGLTLDAAVLTNIRRSSLGMHGSRENYLRAKTRLLDCLKPTGFAVVNADDPATHQLLDHIQSPVLSIGIHQAAELTAKMLERDLSSQTFVLRAGSESIPVRTRIIGKQHVYNCLSAAAVGLTLGIDLPTIAQGLEAAVIPGRLERVDCGQSFGVWIDSAKSPTQVATAIAAVGCGTHGRVWCVCSTDEGQTTEDRRQLGSILEKTTDIAVITSAKVCQQIDYEPTHQVLDGFENPATAQVIPNRLRAIEYVLSNAGPDDAVIVAGCGERPIAVVGERNWDVCDRDVCQAWLYDNTQLDCHQGDPNIFRFDDFQS
ncbi:MAG: Mur ligase domain-containing protein [Mariniblastus sp.]|nr:Mur ligase domain-containing protein [Mariniblastus sp.]